MRSERGVRRKNGLKSRGIEAGEAVSRSLNSNVYALPRMGLFPNSSRKRPVDFAEPNESRGSSRDEQRRAPR